MAVRSDSRWFLNIFSKCLNGTRGPPPFMANAILNFHFFTLQLTPALFLLKKDSTKRNVKTPQEVRNQRENASKCSKIASKRFRLALAPKNTTRIFAQFAHFCVSGVQKGGRRLTRDVVSRAKPSQEFFARLSSVLPSTSQESGRDRNG